MSDSSTPWTATRQAPLSSTISQQTHVHWVGDAIQQSNPLSPFPFCLQSFAAWESFPMRQLYTSGGQRIGASALASVLPMNTQDWFPLGLTGWISLQSKSLLQRLFFNAQPSLWSNSHMCTWLLEKLTRWTFVSIVMSLLFINNMLSMFVIAFLPRSKSFLISWMQSSSTVILEPKKIKPVTAPLFPLLFLLKWRDWMLWS